MRESLPRSKILIVRSSVFLSFRIIFSILAFCCTASLSSGSIGLEFIHPILAKSENEDDYSGYKWSVKRKMRILQYRTIQCKTQPYGQRSPVGARERDTILTPSQDDRWQLRFGAKLQVYRGVLQSIRCAA